ncbi:MAG: UDP-N-acetylmuramoyl-L-alanine--D-glutamate ligase, partial [Micrococcales bacterium]|nr:UDP-N-acetylmuramoyl-L-alanine--D-glutamate ligase [Micrococcales bacterium]
MSAGPDLPYPPHLPQVAVLGLGVSGLACIDALARTGARITAVDDGGAYVSLGADDGGGYVSLGADDGGAYVSLGARDGDARLPVIAGRDLDLANVDRIVVSPGWKPSSPPLPEALARGIPVWSEVELAWRLRARREVPWLAVTGTNGKTTTTGMLASILTAAGFHAAAAGNIGTPLVTAVADPAIDVFACELSSFQLHFTHSLAPRASALLNVAPDHLDWHGSFAAYTAAKARVFERAGAMIIGPDPELADLAARATPASGAPLIRITLEEPRPGEIGVVAGIIVDRAFGSIPTELAAVSDLTQRSMPAHLLEDALAAIALARVMGVGRDAIVRGLGGFVVAGHRGQVVGVVDGVGYIDDSKATNAHAARAALAGRPERSVVWICGGRAKGARFDELVASVAGVLAGVVVIGADPEPFTQAIG